MSDITDAVYLNISAMVPDAFAETNSSPAKRPAAGRSEPVSGWRFALDLGGG